MPGRNNMTDKTFQYLFRLVGQETGMLIGRYPNDEDILNDLYEDFLVSLEDDPKALRNYITMLIGYAESKEYYEKCATLLKLKGKITD
jgi:hypothetical protein